MNNHTIPEFSVIGLSIRTTNENGQSMQDIPALWTRFISEGILEKIPNKVDDTLYCIYTEYELDHSKPYTTLLGCKVSNTDSVPEGMTSKNFPEAVYTKFEAKGSIMEGVVFNEWVKIWASGMPRAFTSDFEVYGAKAKNPEDAEVDIFIALP